VLTTTNMTDLRLLCEEFGFASLLTQVSDFISRDSIAEDGTRKGLSNITDENLQSHGCLLPVHQVLSGLRTANLHQARTNESLQQSLGLLQKEIAELQTAYSDLRKSNEDHRR
jgi:hypothetical protein